MFRSFTSHIQQQIRSDKQGFVEAQTCTAWFYKQLHQKPPRPQAEGIVFHAPRRIRLQTLDTSDCQTRYPHGLEAAREDFSRTQSSLSLSLTFYEFALVGDRNDDERYSVSELKDMLESFGVSFNAVLAPAVHLAALNAKFDALRKSGGLDVLMASMGTLYDKGYRFTNQDRAALNRVAG
ncbi:MAG: hypothetical protein HY581_08350 [Nitrospirae bacterium]|nr:hypothetical protein [Nitrospirota bacterium]